MFVFLVSLVFWCPVVLFFCCAAVMVSFGSCPLAWGCAAVWEPKGPLPWDPLGSQGFPSHGGSGTPSHGIPWAPKGSLPWGPFGLPRVPSHGIPPNPSPFNFCPAGQKQKNGKRINQRFLARSHMVTRDISQNNQVAGYIS